MDTAQVVDQMLSKQIKGGTIALALQRSPSYNHIPSAVFQNDGSNNETMNDMNDKLYGNDQSWNIGGNLFSILDWNLVRWNKSTCLILKDQEEQGGQQDIFANSHNNG